MLPIYAFDSDAPEWCDAALHGARDSRLPAPAIAHALAIVSTYRYDAWAAYDGQAKGQSVHPKSMEISRTRSRLILSGRVPRALLEPISYWCIAISGILNQAFAS